MPVPVRRSALLCALCLAWSHAARAEPPAKPPADTALRVPAPAGFPEKPRSGWAVLPIGTYTPETQLGLGVFATHFFRIGDASAQTRPSSVSAVGLYTLRSQLIAELIPELYWDDMRFHVWSRLDYRRYPNSLWEVGPAARDDTEEQYTEDRLRWQATLDHEIDGPLRLEGKVEVVSMDLEDVRADGLLASGEVPGSTAGRTVGLGPGLLWDSRDHLLTPRDGELLELAFMAYGEQLGSEHEFVELLIDLRTYQPVLDSHALAFQLYAQVQAGRPTFYDLAQLGGQELLRGYYEGRFRDKTLLAVQVEYRLPLFWRLSGVAHAAVGQVAPGIFELPRYTPKWSVGPGMRLLLNTDEGLNLRADLGLCPEGFGVYVGIAEAY